MVSNEGETAELHGRVLCRRFGLILAAGGEGSVAKAALVVAGGVLEGEGASPMFSPTIGRCGGSGGGFLQVPGTVAFFAVNGQ